MKTDTGLKDRSRITVSGTIAAVSTISGTVIKFSVEICDNLLLKVLISLLLILAFTSACYINILTLKKLSGFSKSIIFLATFIFYLLLCLYVWTKKCTEKANPTVEIREGNIDNSIHNDNRKSYNIPKRSQRSLKKSDIKTLMLGLPEKNAKVLVQYLKDKPIDTLLSNQVSDELFKLGYTDVHLSPATNFPDKLSRGKMTIIKEIIDVQTVYKVIINPQP